MQTTLLGIAIAAIVALAAALAGPLFVNWNNHRAFFEAQASRLLGLEVRVAGAIDARLLPTPSVTLRGVAIGQNGEEARLRAGALAIKLALGSLLSGEIRAVEMRLFAPELRLGLDRAGKLDWPGITSLNRAELAIDRLQIEQGRLILTDAASSARLVLDNLRFVGAVRSLAGPVRGEGEFVTAAGRHHYRLAVGRLGDEGLKLRLTIDSDQPLTIEADGMLALQGAARFEGALTLARPAGAARADGRASLNEPWRVIGRVKAAATSAWFEQLEFQYGPDERAFKLNAKGEIRFGEQPRLQGEIFARRVDLDRLLATTDKILSPMSAAKTLAESFARALQPRMPAELAFNLDAATLGGTVLQAVNGVVSNDGAAWHLDRLDFRAPGLTQVSARGHPEQNTAGFAGTVSVASGDSKALWAWLTGNGFSAAGGAWQARGEVVISADRIAVERLESRSNREVLRGRLAYLWPTAQRPPRLEAELAATELDLDALWQFAATAFAEAQWPRELALALDIDKAQLAGVAARGSTVRLQWDAQGLKLERLVVEDFGGARVQASGRFLPQSLASDTAIAVELDARDLGGVLALAEKFAPPLALQMRRLAGRQPTAKLRAKIETQDAASGPIATLSADGRIGATRISLAARASGKSVSLGALAADLQLAGADFRSAQADADIVLQGSLESEENALALLDLPAGATWPGRLTFTATGPLRGDIRFNGKLDAGPIALAGEGSVRLRGAQPIARLEQFSGVIAGSKVRGQLTLAFDQKARISGAIESDRLDAPAALALLLGLPAQHWGEGAAWLRDPFPRGNFLAGRVEIKTARAELGAGLAVQHMRATLRAEPARLAVEECAGELADGRFVGQLALDNNGDGLALRAHFALADADAADLAGAGQPLTGRLGLQATVEASGLSPAALVGSLRGKGTFILKDARVAGLNPRVFDALSRALGLGIQADANQMKEFVAVILRSDHLAVTRVEGAVVIADGKARLVASQVQAKDADLTVDASVDLASATLDATLTLTGSPQLGRPAISLALKGPLAAPQAAVNVHALTDWVARRAIERQARSITAAARAIPWPASPILSTTATPPAARAPQQQAPAESSESFPATTGSITQVPPLPQPITIPLAGSPRSSAHAASP